MTKFHEWLHLAGAVQVLTAAEMSQNTENQCHINVALVVPYGYCLTGSKGRPKEGS